MSYYINKGIKATGHVNLSNEFDYITGKYKQNEGLILNLTHKSPACIALGETFREWIFKQRCHNPEAKDQLILIDKEIRLWYRENGYDIEKAINITNDPSLAAKMAYELTKTDRNYDKPAISAKNAIVIGDVIIDLLAVTGARKYNIECTQIFDDGSESIVTMRETTDANTTFHGFISGGKYSFRAQAVLSNNTVMEWTVSVELRIN